MNHRKLLEQVEPLDASEKAALRDWLAALRDDVALFGETDEDRMLMDRIKARIAE